MAMNNDNLTLVSLGKHDDWKVSFADGKSGQVMQIQIFKKNPISRSVFPKVRSPDHF